MTRNVHLLVCIHGLWGNPTNLAELARIARAKHSRQPDPPNAAADGADAGAELDLDVLVTKSNADDNTYDGIDWGAERVAEEIQAHISTVQEDGSRRITRFSVVGYSLGGLLARYLLGILHTRKFFDTVEPCNFITISTPHIGLPRYPGFLSACFNVFSPRILSRSGEQLSLSDKWSDTQRPLLQVMTDKNSIFFQTLNRFPHIHIYANAINDVTVPYLTGAIELEDPFLSPHNLQIDIDEDYTPLIKRMTRRDAELTPPGPGVFSMAFLRSLKPRPLPLPKPLQYLIWPLAPLLLPLFISYILLRLSLKSRASRVRILGLEQCVRASGAETLIDTLRVLEKTADGAVEVIVEAAAAAGAGTGGRDEHISGNGMAGGVTDGVDDGNGSGADTAASTHASTPIPTPPDSPDPLSSPPPLTPPHTSTSPPRLTPLQRTLVTTLNALPQLHKHLAYIDGVLNAHAAIVCRDVQRYAMHRRGEGVLRHIADGLVI